jgi:hypothetical protein
MNPLELPPEDVEDGGEQARVAAQIDLLYDEMRALVARHAGRPGLREALRPLRERMRTLQQIEAEEILRHYDLQFHTNYKEAGQLIHEARRLSARQ